MKTSKKNPQTVLVAQRVYEYHPRSHWMWQTADPVDDPSEVQDYFKDSIGHMLTPVELEDDYEFICISSIVLPELSPEGEETGGFVFQCFVEGDNDDDLVAWSKAGDDADEFLAVLWDITPEDRHGCKVIAGEEFESYEDLNDWMFDDSEYVKDLVFHREDGTRNWVFGS